MNLQELTKQLSTYGLNPAEWTLRPESLDLFKIQSKEDKNFFFVGKAEKKDAKIHWISIELLSI
jgi:hypothetical protein